MIASHMFWWHILLWLIIMCFFWSWFSLGPGNRGRCLPLGSRWASCSRNFTCLRFASTCFIRLFHLFLCTCFVCCYCTLLCCFQSLLVLVLVFSFVVFVRYLLVLLFLCDGLSNCFFRFSTFGFASLRGIHGWLCLFKLLKSSIDIFGSHNGWQRVFACLVNMSCWGRMTWQRRKHFTSTRESCTGGRYCGQNRSISHWFALRSRWLGMFWTCVHMWTPPTPNSIQQIVDCLWRRSWQCGHVIILVSGPSNVK